jgi:two-component system, OmpR family, sensor kinase
MVKAGHRRARPWEPLRRISDRTPLRTKLITAVLALVIMALLAISIASVAMLRGYVTTQHDGRLQNALVNINEGALQPFAGYAWPVPGSEMIVALQSPGQQLVWGATGLPNYGGPGSKESLPRLPTSANWANSPNGTLITAPAQSGPTSWRVIGTLDTNLVSGQPATLVVAIPLGNIDAMTRQLAVFDLIVGGVIVVVLAAVGVAVVRSNLRPLDDIEMTAGQIAKGHLNHRIPERDPRTEIGSLGRSLNAMLSQIETAFHAQEESEQAAHESEERMRRFVADASHELRTPLTTIRGFAEYYRQRGGVTGGREVREDQDPASRTNGAAPVSADDYSAEGLTPHELDRIMQRLEAEAARMGLLVEDLLQLARLDQQRPLVMAPVDLLMLAADAVQDARMVAPDRPIDLQVAPGAAFLVEGDEARLRQVIGNLVNNALTYTPPATPVRVKIASGTLTPPAKGGGTSGPAVPAVVLDVEDDGPGMTAEQAQRVFERFYRADQARNRASGGTGLGLAIVVGLVAAHGGTVSVRTAPGQGADFQVKLPLSPDAQVDDHDRDDQDDPDDRDGSPEPPQRPQPPEPPQPSEPDHEGSQARTR